ncbi:T9SS type A sorting domain-containing protein [Tenacibaculum sp. M341]|uniref:T9SS type A sorting domain-containing protein n=1 Tax=Tenacibaculum sp. M341 TaxID=2530339 RepID=UPI001045B8DD|nr:T9SS type A sorting domain-containing protein [Tenacibaculum sp. M341]TCI89979.1 T9SS type A sorting domain-containing protein [Tenacibaculum sp. M341]
MKLKFSLILFFIINSFLWAQETYVPDNNFENYLETHDANGNIVTLGSATSLGNGIASDDYVTTSKISNLTSLNISSSMIADITGIEDFTKLMTLDCSDNSLTTLNISNNSALKTLLCFRNDLQSIDVRQNTQLITISIFRNQLQTLDLSNNLDLNYLICSNNELSSIDLTNNTKLERVSIYDNPTLNNLNVTNLPLLKDLDCVNTNLSSLDVSQNSELEYLQAYENQLTSLDLSKNVKLIELYVEDNQLMSLDVSKNTILEDLSCARNALTYLNIKNGNNTNLDERDFDITGNLGLTCVSVDDVTFANTNFTKKDAQTIYSISCTETYTPDDNFENFLETHDADNNVVSVGDPTSMGNGIANDNKVYTSNIENVTRLFIANASISDLTGLEDFANLEELFCFGNVINSSLDLTSLTKLERFQGGDMGLTNINVTDLTSLYDLDAPRNNLTSVNVTTNAALTRLILSNNNLTGVDVSTNVLLEDLQVHETTLTSVDVTNNPLLTRLTISLNQISSINIENNPLIENLTVSRNPLTDIDVSHLANLEDISINNTNITSIDFSNNTKLVEVYMDECPNLSYVNVKNGNNAIISDFEVDNNPSLTCIEVDDPTASYLTSWTKDAAASYAQYCRFTYVPNDNFENYLETHRENTGGVSFGDARSLGNGVMDDLVPTEKIENLTILFIEEQSIIDFTGLEDFLALERFRAYGNPVNGALDLTANTNLNQVFCWNMGLTDINITGLENLLALAVNENDLDNIDISTNTNLEDVVLYDNNLTSLDVTQNTSLIGLNYVDNAITTIDLSQNSNLKFLYCNNNDVTELNLQGTPLIETLELNNNPISSIDVSALANLVNLDFSNTNVSSIDVSNSLNLSLLECNDTSLITLDVTKNTALRTLNTQNNSITTLDLGNNTNLNALNAANNQLTYVNLKSGETDGISTVDITNNPGLTCIEVDDPAASYLNTWSKDITVNFAEYCRFTAVPDANFEEYLETHAIYGNSVALGNANSLGNGIIDDGLVPTEKLEQAQFLYLSNLGITDFTGLEDCANVTRLFLTGNTVSNLDVTANTKLDRLFAADLGLTSLNISGLTELKQLELNNNELNTIDVSEFTNLSELYVTDNNLSDLNISTNNLTYLDISNNSISNIDLSGQTNLESFKCDGTTITTLNFDNNTNLETLSFLDTYISSIDVTALVNLRNLTFSDTNIAEIDLSKNTNMSRLFCDETPLTFLNLSSLIILDDFSCKNGQLTNLNLKNGNASDLNNVDVTGNPSLTCIEVDDPLSADITGWLKDATANYAEFCRMTYVPNDNFEAVLEARGFGNGVTNDNYVYTSLIENETALIVQNNDITDATGIEDFKALELLLIRRSNLETINLTQNTKLTCLNLTNNALTSIDVSKNILLQEVYLDSNSILGTVDISTLSELTNLGVSDTGINTIDVSSNPLIRVLNLDDNNFTTLDISSYPSITQLRITNNQLTSLNVATGNNASFTWFDATGNPSLRCIKVDDVNVNLSLWFKDATASYALYCDLTLITDANFENYLETHDANGNIVSLGDTSSLGNGIIDDNQVPTEKIKTVIDLDLSNLDIAGLTGIEGFTALESLNVDYNDLTALDISNNTNLRILDAAENELTFLDLSTNIALEEVELRSNKIVTLVTNNPNLRKLRASKNSFAYLNLTNCPLLEEISLTQTLLVTLDISNGNNDQITDFNASYNDYLTCIEIDDASASYLSTWNKDATANFTENCNTAIWTGKNGTNWTDTENWIKDSVALSSQNVVVPVLVTSPTIESGVLAEMNDLKIHDLSSFTIEDNGAATVNGDFETAETAFIKSSINTSGTLIVKGSSNGTISYERSGLESNKWSIITAPVSGQSIKEFVENSANEIRVNTTVTPNRYAVAYYDDSKADGSKWTYYTTTDLVDNSILFEEGKAYIISRKTNGSVTFTGSLTTTNKTVNVNGDQWNAVGNPYTAYLPINNNSDNNFIQENLSKFSPAYVGVYVWNNTQNKYVAKTLAGPPTSLTVGKGFFIRTNVGENTIDFKESQRSHDASDVQVFSKGKTSDTSVQILATSEGISVDTNIKYTSNASINLDPGYDVANFDGATFDIFTGLVAENNEYNFTIQSLPNTNYESMIVPLGIKATANSKIQLTAVTKNLPEGVEVYIEDKKLNTFTSLNKEYIINVDKAINGTGRFYLHTTTSSVLSTEEIIETNTKVQIFKSNKQNIKVTGLTFGTSASINIHTITGKEIFKSNFTANHTNEFTPSNLAMGVYVVSITTENGIISKKLVFEN